jgi:hypothetical protein
VSDVDRLRAELALAEASQRLEAAREAMHADRSDAAKLRAYRRASERVVELRRDYRENHRPAAGGPGDAAPQPKTVRASSRVSS